MPLYLRVTVALCCADSVLQKAQPELQYSCHSTPFCERFSQKGVEWHESLKTVNSVLSTSLMETAVQ